MKLKEYIEEVGIPINEFARRLKISPATIYNIFNDKDIRLSVAVKIEEATKGKVKCRELLSPDYLKDQELDRSQRVRNKNNSHNKEECYEKGIKNESSI